MKNKMVDTSALRLKLLAQDTIIDLSIEDYPLIDRSIVKTSMKATIKVANTSLTVVVSVCVLR